MHQFAGFEQLGGHVGKRAGQSAEFVARGKYRLAAQVTARHLAHTLGQQQQGTGELVAQPYRNQQGAEHGQHQRQRECADVHLAQPTTGQRALLVLTVGALNRQRVDGQAGRHRLRHQEKVILCAKGERCRRDVGEGLDARGGRIRSRIFIQSDQFADHSGVARALAHLSRNGAAGQQAAAH